MFALARKARTFAKVFAATAALTFTLTVPQASAADGAETNHSNSKVVAGVELAPGAKDSAVAYAKGHPEQVAAMSNLCGGGYELFMVQRLPRPDTRWGTLFSYINQAESSDSVYPGYEYLCAFMDNNTSGRKTMEIKACENRVNGYCDTDAGYFASYAGPVKLSAYKAHENRLMCSSVHMYMEGNSGNTMINESRYLTPCN